MAIVGVGSSIGGYTLEARLGEGGMADVFRAVGSAGEHVAIKILTLLDNVEVTIRFEQEARLLSEVRHPHLVKVFAAGIEDDVPYMVMELIEGTTLAQLLSTGQPMPLSKVQPIFEQLADALIALHDARVIHRDVKPGNVMIGADGWVTLLDLGIARDGDGNMTRAGIMYGTPGFMAPEQIRGERRVTIAADVYSFAVMWWLAVVGTPVFSSNADTLLFDHLEAARPKLSDARPDLPPQLTGVLMRAMAPNPKQRTPSVAELWNQICSALAASFTPSPRNRLLTLAGVPAVVPPKSKEDEADQIRALLEGVVEQMVDRAASRKTLIDQPAQVSAGKRLGAPVKVRTPLPNEDETEPMGAALPQPKDRGSPLPTGGEAQNVFKRLLMKLGLSR